MNIAYFIITKNEVAYLYDEFTMRQGLEKMKYHGYSAIPVLTSENKYLGTISEGDFLWYLVDSKNTDSYKKLMTEIEDIKIKDVIKPDKNPPVHITATIEELLVRAMEQNFIPVIDDRDYFIGIITRKDIIKHFIQSK